MPDGLAAPVEGQPWFTRKPPIRHELIAAHLPDRHRHREPGPNEFQDSPLVGELGRSVATSRYPKHPAPTSGGSDEVGDIGLGRQQLQLKWLLEGEYITVPGQFLTGKPLDEPQAQA